MNSKACVELQLLENLLLKETNYGMANRKRDTKFFYKLIKRQREPKNTSLMICMLPTPATWVSQKM